MQQPALIAQIRDLLGFKVFKPAPVRPHDPLGGLMAYKRGTPKYQLDEQGKLIGLNLAKTRLTDARWAQLVALPGFVPGDVRGLNVSDNQLTDFKLPDGMRNLERLNVDDNPLKFPPVEIVQKGNAAILRYLKEILSQGEDEVYEVKMLIVGEGETGKTTLWNKLRDLDYPVPQSREVQPSTVGIQIHEGWTVSHPEKLGENFVIHMWDFGGQEI
ncbi:MAG: hypothetical protein OHK0039_48270 [Bacteroidia bacterium]